eukprot:TRINITY_DN39746_c0_g1_i1.p3 TRINITY_DN39746_c0_g1~~TRINITY_DN39746_c0_g1_i1.p3  ORF type:complete len:145 (-),score=6.26 TRINITY_DN39746_c0_g1_i1:803-1237(-)
MTATSKPPYLCFGFMTFAAFAVTCAGPPLVVELAPPALEVPEAPELEPEVPVGGAAVVAKVVPLLPDPEPPEELPVPVADAFEPDELWAKTPPDVGVVVPVAVELPAVEEATVELPAEDPEAEDELGPLDAPQFGPSLDDLMLW